MIKNVNFLITSFIILSSCSSGIDIEKLDGKWKSRVISKNMGGYNISSYDELRISLDTIINDFMDPPQSRIDFEYGFTSYVSDEMYGTKNKPLSSGGGDIELKSRGNKLYFKSGEYYDKGAYIEISESEMEYPRMFTLHFAPLNGDSKIFYKEIDEEEELLIRVQRNLKKCRTKKINMKDYSELNNGIYANIETDKGDIILELFFKQTPLTVSNFVALSEGNHPAADEQFSCIPYYDGLKFHRVIDNFMIQGGDPTGTGAGGPGFQFDDEFSEELKHTGPGILSMANAGPGTNGSQFFITHLETPWLDGKHSVFGKVNSGQDVVDNIAQDDFIKSVKIIRIGKDAEEFDAPKIFKDYVINKSQSDILKAEEEAKLLDDLTSGMIETESGLKYKVSKKGSGPNAKIDDVLSVHYSLKLVDGSEIDSSFTRGEPIEFTCGVGQVIKGWDEAMQLLNKGSKATLVIPSELGYGSTGAGNGVIPPNATLIFEVELVDIK